MPCYNGMWLTFRGKLLPGSLWYGWLWSMLSICIVGGSG